MFTDIIREIGKIKEIIKNEKSLEITIYSDKVIADCSKGDSIAVNGVCLTIKELDKTSFSIDVIPETYNFTNLKFLNKNSIVNLEGSLRINEQIGGHFVSGHIDVTAKIVSINKVENAYYMELEMDDSLIKDCILKGSVTINGTSLTVFGIKNKFLTISLIPHTIENTTFKENVIGDTVNVECDMLGKYVRNILNNQINSIS